VACHYVRPLSVLILLDSLSHRSKGFGFMEAFSDEEADAMVEALNGSQLENRAITVSRPRPMTNRPVGGESSTSNSQGLLQREARQKAYYGFQELTATATKASAREVPAVSRLIALLSRYPSELERVSPKELEGVVAEMLAHEGYTLEFPARTRDGGKDIIAMKRDTDETQVLYVECKQRSSRPVEVTAARSLAGTMILDDVKRGLMVTTTRFTAPTHKQVAQLKSRASSYELTLCQGADLVERIKRSIFDEMTDQ